MWCRHVSVFRFTPKTLLMLYAGKLLAMQTGTFQSGTFQSGTFQSGTFQTGTYQTGTFQTRTLYLKQN